METIFNHLKGWFGEIISNFTLVYKTTLFDDAHTLFIRLVTGNLYSITFHMLKTNDRESFSKKRSQSFVEVHRRRSVADAQSPLIQCS